MFHRDASMLKNLAAAAVHRFKALSINESICTIKFDYVIRDVCYYSEDKTLSMCVLVEHVCGI